MLSEQKSESPEQRAGALQNTMPIAGRPRPFRQLRKAFDFGLQGEHKSGGYYLVTATPRRGYQPPNRDTEVPTAMEGRLWIDTKTFQWVKMEATRDPSRQDGRLPAQVEPATRFEIETSPVEHDIWLTKHDSMRKRRQKSCSWYLKRMTLFQHHNQPTSPSDTLSGDET
jgi:hypothetical protein